MSFPSKTERENCWKARDRYWECLDQCAQGPESKECLDLRRLYLQSCPAQWVKHFDRKWSYLRFKRQIETEGYEPIGK